MLAPAASLTHSGSPQHSKTDRDQRIARALRSRLAEIRNEMDSALRQREQSYRRADALLDEFDHLTVSAEGLRSALGQVELRLQQAGGYFITEEQAETILDQIAEVGADLPRFCAFVGVDGIALIPAHEFETALAALEAKRESVRRVA